MLIFSEKLVIDTLKLESLNDLDGYKEVWVLMEDLDQQALLEAELVTTPFDLHDTDGGKDRGVL